jgi:hypothetical protein
VRVIANFSSAALSAFFSDGAIQIIIQFPQVP